MHLVYVNEGQDKFTGVSDSPVLMSDAQIVLRVKSEVQRKHPVPLASR